MHRKSPIARFLHTSWIVPIRFSWPCPTGLQKVLQNLSSNNNKLWCYFILYWYRLTVYLILNLRAWAKLKAQSRRYEAVFETQPRTYSIVCIPWWMQISWKLSSSSCPATGAAAAPSPGCNWDAPLSSTMPPPFTLSNWNEHKSNSFMSSSYWFDRK